MIREFVKANLLPLAPPASKSDPMLAAWPIHNVETSGAINCMVSYIANPEEITPPGELM